MSSSWMQHDRSGPANVSARHNVIESVLHQGLQQQTIDFTFDLCYCPYDRIDKYERTRT